MYLPLNATTAARAAVVLGASRQLAFRIGRRIATA